ncbi:hypothetical protein [Actinoplanes teichomyceticus]|uniref:Uncharacterized protein n=1 Tax=Actinoplanes teichomyceticus TaxID=1867 RepID=A0A561WJ05_ACTTI|nr:hypothetical protein [Actinoplanes teichomyceticus]TWG23800.1 hypothetical protein FHX34_102351 [Actinoplanes teichomyceticus]GIF11846.1 hypothetical protein Ate01nite_18780 [Actinoplanes teichomyceticus]
MSGILEHLHLPRSIRRASDGVHPPASPAERDHEVESTAEAGTPGAEVAPAAEVTPAGTASPQQPALDLTNEPVRPWQANVSALQETLDQHTFRLGPMEIVVYSAERVGDTSFQAAGTSMLRFTYGGLATGVVTAGASQLLANPRGIDLLLLGGAPGAGIVVLGVALNTYRILRYHVP